jgi:hypothetical protein
MFKKLFENKIDKFIDKVENLVYTHNMLTVKDQKELEKDLDKLKVQKWNINEIIDYIDSLVYEYDNLQDEDIKKLIKMIGK